MGWGSGGEEEGELAEDLVAQRCQGVFDLAPAVSFVHELGQGQPADVLTSGLAAHGNPLADLPKGKPGFSLEKLENLDPAVVGHSLEHPFKLPENRRVHIGYNHGK